MHFYTSMKFGKLAAVTDPIIFRYSAKLDVRQFLWKVQFFRFMKFLCPCPSY